MVDKPTKHLGWVNEGTEPTSGLKNAGYAAGSIPASANFNWFFNIIDQWNKWSEQEIEALQNSASSAWYSGSGAPSNGLGEDDDYYLNTSNGDVYTKTSGSWNSPIMNLTGPQGPTGSTGATGSMGASGPQGDPGPGLPSGGTTGQLIRKASGTDYDTEFFDSTYASGPASSTDHAIPRFDGTGGKTLQDSSVVIDDSDNVSGINDLTTDGDVNVGTDLDVAGDAQFDQDVVIDGDLTVNGTTTTLNTEDLQVEDQLIQLNYGGNDASAEDAGIEIVGTANAAVARILHDSSLPSKFKAGAAGSEVELLNIDATQDVQNKSLDNTNDAELDDDNFTLQDPGDPSKKIRFDAGNTTAGQTRVVSFPDADAEMVGVDTAQTVTNKVFEENDFDGGTASDTSRVTLPKDDLNDLIALTRKAGTLMYAPDILRALLDDGTTLRPIQGRRNYCSSPSFFVSAASSSDLGWYAEDGTAANETIGGTIPRESDGSAIVFTSNNTGSYLRYRFKADTADLLGRAILTAFSQIVNAASEYKLEVYSGTDAALSSPALLTIQSGLTNSSGITNLPAGTMDIDQAFFHTNDRQYYEIRWTALASAKQIKVSGVFLGQQEIGSVPAVSDAIDWSSLFSFSQGVTASSVSAQYEQTASRVRFLVTYTVSGNTGSAARLTLPFSWTAKILGSATVIGEWFNNSNSTATNRKRGTIFASNGNNYVSFGSDDYTTAAGPIAELAGNVMAGTSSVVTLDFTLNISQLAGSGLNTGPGADGELKSTSGTWDANSSTTVAGGSAIDGTLNAGRTKTITWTYPIQSDDDFQVLYSPDNVRWTPINMSRIGSTPVIPSVDSSGAVLAGVYYSHISETQTEIVFGQYANFGNDDSPVANWPASGYWAARKRRANSIPFQIAKGQQSGLYKAGQAPGYNGAAAIPQGMIGEILSASPGNVTLADVAGTAKTVATLPLTAGIWMVYGLSTCNLAGSTTVYYDTSISTTTNTHRTAGTQRGYVNSATAPRVGAPPLYLRTTGQDVYLVASMSGTGTVPATIGSSSELYAVRIG